MFLILIAAISLSQLEDGGNAPASSSATGIQSETPTSCPGAQEVAARAARLEALRAGPNEVWLREWTPALGRYKRARDCTPATLGEYIAAERQADQDDELRARRQAELEAQRAEQARQIAEMERESRRLAEQEEAEYQALRSDKRTKNLVASTVYCAASSVEKEILKAIKEETENSKIANVRNEALLLQYQNQVVASRRIQKASLAATTTGKLTHPCTSPAVKELMRCAKDADQEGCGTARTKAMVRVHAEHIVAILGPALGDRPEGAKDSDSGAAPGCKPEDIAVTNVRLRVDGDSAYATGIIHNNCATRTGVELMLTVYDDSGAVLHVDSFWPNSISNIPAGSELPFKSTRFPRAGGSKFDIRVKSTNVW